MENGCLIKVTEPHRGARRFMVFQSNWRVGLMLWSRCHWRICLYVIKPAICLIECFDPLFQYLEQVLIVLENDADLDLLRVNTECLGLDIPVLVHLEGLVSLEHWNELLNWFGVECVELAQDFDWRLQGLERLLQDLKLLNVSNEDYLILFLLNFSSSLGSFNFLLCSSIINLLNCLLKKLGPLNALLLSSLHLGRFIRFFHQNLLLDIQSLFVLLLFLVCLLFGHREQIHLGCRPRLT